MTIKRLAVIGDLHLGKLSALIPKHLELQMRCIDEILAKVKDEGISTVVLLGDVFDKPTVNTSILNSLLTMFVKHKDLKFHWVAGNHEKTSKEKMHIDFFAYMKKLKLIRNVKVHVKSTKIGDLAFLPYPQKTPLAFVNFAHIERPGVALDNGHVLKSKSKWPEKSNFVIGHIHTPQTVGKNTHYTGTPFQLSFGENEDKYWAIVEYDKKTKHFLHIPVPVQKPYTLINIHIDSKKDLKTFLKYKKDEPIYYKLKVNPSIKTPSNLLTANPNILVANISSKRITQKVKTLENENDTFQVSLTHLLEDFLENQKLSKSDIKWAVKLVRKNIKSSK